MSQAPTTSITFDLPSKAGPVQGSHLPMRKGETSVCDKKLRLLRIDTTNPSAGCDAVPTSYFLVKEMIESVLTIGLLVPSIPIMVTVAGVILITQGRPVFFRQTRVGKSGKLFRIWKFRSMQRDAEKQTGATWAGSDDPRVTAVGRWLRCSHIDELPQLINVLRGDMSLVGPRPERPEFVSELSRELPTYMERLRVRPGITGLAQLKLGYDHCVSDVQHKVELDIHYINTASLLGDWRLLLATIPYVAKTLLQKFVGGRCSLATLPGKPHAPKSIRLLAKSDSITTSTPQSPAREFAASLE